MYELKFRALNGKGIWVYGINKSTAMVAPVVENSENHIISMENFWSLIECGYLKRHTVGQFIWHKDKRDNELYTDDVIAEGLIDKIIWDGKAIITDRPYGFISVTPYVINVEQVHVGAAKLTDKATEMLKNYPNGISPLNMDCYDGVFQWPDDIECIGNVWQNPELLELVE